ncbi:MAG: PD-(D/E)XK nuclease family transposase [Campylobacterota bacterium]|nr:PD-(D/E)XK nuclease family transposase [Campylobacterota bacterium]
MNFLDVKTDYAFKKVFGSDTSKDILISFLNAILGDKNQDKHIKNFQLLKSSVLSINGTTVNNQNIFIRFKNISSTNDIALFSNMDEIDLILEENNYKWSDFDFFFNIFICSGFVLFKYSSDNYVSFMFIPDKYTYKMDLVYFDGFIELPKFKKSLKECKNIEDNWLYFIKNSEELTIVPKDVENEIKTAYEIAKHDGRTQGIEQEKIDIAIKSKEQGINNTTISLITGLTIEQIQSL